MSHPAAEAAEAAETMLLEAVYRLSQTYYDITTGTTIVFKKLIRNIFWLHTLKKIGKLKL